MRILPIIIGALAGSILVDGSRGLFGMLAGALLGYALSEISGLRTRLRQLEEQVHLLRRQTTAPSPRTAPTGEITGTAPRASTPPSSEEPVSPPAWRASRPAQRYGIPAPAEPEAPSVPSHLRDYRDLIAANSTDDMSAPRQGEASQARAAAPRQPTTGVAGAGQPPAEPPIFRVIREYFTGGNTLVRVGIVILFFGVAFLLRHVAEQTELPIEFRLLGVTIGAIVLLALGWRLRTKRLGYALALQGGAVGILYLTVFAALRLYALMPPGLAFTLLVLLAAFSSVLAILQNSQAFAVLSVVGGFLAPVLASTGEGSHVALFSYYAVLNGGILTIAWFKAWRLLNLVGFAFTFVIATVWGVLRYQDEYFASTEPFLASFFLFYVALAVLFALRQPPQLRGYVDGTLVFGTPIAAFALQSAIAHDRPYVLAFSALAVSGLYLGLAWFLHRTRRSTARLLVEAFMALGVAFLTLAVPLALDGRWSAATWALEGTALVWIGCRQHRRAPRVFGALLQVAAGSIFLRDLDAPYANVPILNSAYLGGLMVSAASVFSAYLLEKNRERLAPYEIWAAPALFLWGLLWWLLAGLVEIDRRVPAQYVMNVALLFVTATAMLSSELHRRFGLRVARWPALCLLPALFVFALSTVPDHEHPFAAGGWIAWPLAFAGFYFVCRREGTPPGTPIANALHAGSFWLLAALASWEVAWIADRAVQGSGSWPAIGWALVPAAALTLLPRLAQRIEWPFGLHREAYGVIAGGGIMAYLVLWSLVTNLTMHGDPYPLPYVPLLNPLDLMEGLVVLVLVRYWLHVRTGEYETARRLPDPPIVGTLAGVAFIWLNTVLLRTIHHWADVPYRPDALLSSTIVQTALSIFWTVLALTAMLIATRRAHRIVWLTGAALLTVVIAKLFLVDLSRIGTVERIISFVGVGLLMLVIGYFSPLPPAAKEGR